MMRANTIDGVLFAHVEGETTEESEDADAIVLANEGEKKQKTEYEKKKRAGITCHRCQQNCHYANTCDNPRVEREREPRQTGEQMLTAGIMDGEFDNEEGYVFHQ